MRRFVLGWKKSGHEQRWQAYIVNYADDLVICCREGAEQVLVTMQRMMSKMKLTVNEAKTRICKLPEEKFDFLGYTFGRCYSPETGRAYLGTVPARKRIQRICGEIHATTLHTRTSLETAAVVAKLNRMLVGWANYFCLGPVSKAYRAVDQYAKMRLRLWLRTKHKVLGRANEVFPDKHLYGALGLVRLDLRTRNFPWAKA
jgi:RNA-directed DNA polymerase